ncbi:Unconventional myosin heavy chain 6 [Meloidogyne graminicola]|uniref:Unconventional myosin heavy chain 6 n=1 Tax=Meloidogyne graminicola TaxID=189291 RepID=A0A8S9ZXI4_9BILA|nr:Unconventional myosin heavy chain 6 [Meloidogyne graminicola]
MEGRFVDLRMSMNELMRRLESCPEAFFVRCLKTNDAQKEKLFETETVLRQMRQFDMISTVAMCRACFPIHMEYINFVRRYRPLMPGIPSPLYCDCIQTTIFICQTIFGDSCKEFVQFGKNKAFLKSEQHQFLEMLRSRRLNCCAALVKKYLLGWTKRRQYARLRWATLIFQKHWRGFTRLQALIRSHQLVIRYQWLKSIIAHFQANCRASLLRYQLQCLVTRAERHCAMMARLDYQMESEGEPPALELHKNEFINIIKERNFGSIKILNCLNDKNYKETKINDKNNSFNWAKYALANFQQTKNTPKHTRTLLEHSLLAHKKPLDELVSMSIWRRLLQLIGDNDASDCAAFEGNNLKINLNKNSTPILSKLKSLYSFDFSDDEINFIKAHLLNFQTYQENCLILKKSIKIAKNILLGEANWSAFEKIKFIISVGIYRPSLRDEIYSQICKQINYNPSFDSSFRCWILLAICSSSFSPTSKLIPYLINFINLNSPNILLKNFINKQLNKTIKYGSRREPCLKAEFAFICSINNNLNNNSKLFIQINLPNEQIIDIPIHSQITISNVFQLLIEKICLKEFFGFGLFISIGKQNIRSLVIGDERLLDVLSLIEEQNNDNNINWKLYLRKELFLPLENDSDELAIELCYQQIIKGIKFGEYKCYKEEDLALLAAQQYFILNNKKSKEIDICELEDNLYEYLPLNVLKQNEDENLSLKNIEEIEKEECQKWVQLILHAYRKKILNNNNNNNDLIQYPNIKQIKYSIIKFASLQWPLNFSRFFELYKFSGPPLPVNQITIAVNSQGIILLDSNNYNKQNNQEKQQILFKIEFIELLNIGYGKSKHEGADAIFINLLNGDRYTFQSSLAKELSYLLTNILQSDLLILSSPYFNNLNNNNNNELELNFIENVENNRTKIKGKVPFNFIHILAYGNITSNVFGAYTLNGNKEPELWRHSFEPLRGPLLKRINELGNEIIIKESLISYSFILKYMGDCISNPPQQFYLEHTDYIFTPPIKYEILRDEIYCQLMKQLTDNPNPLSEERGWELMWLCIGLFPPSKFLCHEVEHFLRTRFVPMATDCSMRLQKALNHCNSDYCRLSPPHQVELEAIQYRQTQIYHKFYLPDGTQETIEVESWTRAKDFSKKIANRLGLLNSLKGFGLFIKLGEKVVCMPEQEYFFDFINQIQDWARKNFRRENILNNGNKFLSSGINFNYQVHFMRKLWLDVEPGKDIRQDIIFNYPQELPKYLRGYHQIDKNEAIQFAALILRAQIKDDKQIPIQHIQHILHELIPIDLLKSFSPNEWKKLISSELQKEGIPKTSTDAKLCFLSKIAKEPTFGSAFFEVKQSADPTLCSKLLVVINKDGMNLYELENKKYIRTHEFKQLSNWQSANTYFHLTLNNGNRLLFETTLGHKLDDLLTSYIQALISKQEKENGKQRISPLSKIAVLLHQYKPTNNNNNELSSPN